MLLSFILLLPLCAQGGEKISPDFVVERMLRESRAAKAIDLDAQGAYSAYYNTFGLYDITTLATFEYEDSRLRTISGGGNTRDQTRTWTVGASKRMPTGTVLGISYSRAHQDSIFRSGVATSTRAPSVVYDYGTVTLSQDLLGNFFGIAERKNLRAAEQLLDSATLEKKEKQENLVLEALRLFWDTYVAKETLSEAKAQREKYQALVKEVQNKNRLGFSAPGDLPKAKAEFGAQVRNVEAASYGYVQNLNNLFTAMRVAPGGQEVEFEFSAALPPLPTMMMPEVESLRAVSVNQVLFDSAELTRQAQEVSSSWPELKLVGAADFSGLDTTRARAFEHVRQGAFPRYQVGLELSYRLFSDTYRGALNQANVNSDRAFNEVLRVKEDLRRQISTSIEQVRSTYQAAVSASEELVEWEKAVKAQESTYRQGRLDFSQLIQDYNSYFRARLTRIRALGDYHIAIHSYEASVDRLVQ